VGWGALNGIKVVDLSHMLSGPYCTMLLADHGADVVKIEPLTGDGARLFGPFPGDTPEGGYGAYFQSVNRNKRSLALDLRRPEGKEAVRRLIAGADVVVENFRPGVMDRMGLSYDSLHALNPRLVYAAIRGFGDERTGLGPLGDLPAFDLNAQAMGGFMSITGPPGKPMKAGPGIGDIFPAAMCCIGILAAMVSRQTTGEGQYLDVAMYDAMIALCERIVYQYSVTGVAPAGIANDHPILAPFGIFPCADGSVSIAAPSDDLYVKLCQCMGQPELATDLRFRTATARIANAVELYDVIQTWTSQHPTADVFKLLGGAVPVGPVQDAAAIAADPQVGVREMIIPLEQPGSQAPVDVAGVPIKFASTPGAVRRRAPLLGEHSAEVLGESGFSAGEVATLREAGVIS
jgi:crotonobetainyl-CoA:carnitine CoA-transferase CaiB-like acyl-CoA transferase